MPRNALNNVAIDHCLPLSEMGALIHRLVPLELGEREPVPESILIEAKIAERVLSDLPSVKTRYGRCAHLAPAAELRSISEIALKRTP